jgi:hypothetical protein
MYRAVYVALPRQLEQDRLLPRRDSMLTTVAKNK